MSMLMPQPRRHPNRATPLAHSMLAVTITDLAAEYEVRHTFRNEGTAPIEAIYSFPVPLDSAFMGMEATLAGERCVAQIQPRARANQNYDQAIADGDSAVLLERLEPGMLCVSLGNLRPGEEGEVVLRFAAPLRCAGGTARFSLPLVHRPRYGRSRLDELTEPRHDFAVEHPLDAEIRMRGLLAHAPVSCATHAVRFASDRNGQSLRFNQAMLDRDLVLVFELPASFAGEARFVRDQDAAIGVLTFNVPSAVSEPGPCDICLVMDGSGSMTGDAIAQSRAAVAAIADLLSDSDRIQVLRFGSTTVPLFRRPLKASVRVRNAMQELAPALDSDLGGTEIGIALDRAMDAITGLEPGAGRRRAILLVTDGAVEPREVEDARARACQCDIRIFIIAVGSSAGADVLAPLAAETLGVLERAVPAEPIDEVATRQFRRAREAGPVAVTVDWGAQDAMPLPLEPAYPGDAMAAIAMLPADRTFAPVVRIAGEARQFSLDHAEDAPALRALAGHAAWRCATSAAKAALALRYGLVTDEASAVLVKVRADGQKVEGLPTVVPVAHMVPDGMVVAAMSVTRDAADSYEYLDMPAFLHRSGDGSAPVTKRRREPKPPVVVPVLEPAARDALLHALIRLLLDENASDATLDALCEAVDRAWRAPIEAYLLAKYPRGFGRRSAIKLLQKLLAQDTGVLLDDDQEAQWATLAARV